MFSAREIRKAAGLIEARLEEYRKSRTDLAELTNEVAKLERKLADAELRVRTDLLSDFGSLGRNAEERKLRIDNALANDPEVKELRAKLAEASAQLQIKKAEAAHTYMALRSAIAIAEMFSSRDIDPDLTA